MVNFDGINKESDILDHKFKILMIDKQIRKDLDDMQKHTAETKYFKNPNTVDKFDSNTNNIYKV